MPNRIPWLPAPLKPTSPDSPQPGDLPSTCGNDIFQKSPIYKKLAAQQLAAEAKLSKGLKVAATPLADYIPKLSDKLKIICVNFHIFRDANGSGHFQTNEVPRLQLILEWANQPYGTNLAPPSDPPIPSYPPIKDTRIRFVLNQVEFYDDNLLHLSTNVMQLQAAAVARNPKALDQLNVYFTNGKYGTASGFAQFPSAIDMTFNSYVVMLGYAGPSGDWPKAGTLAHELGHALDLAHTYSGGGSSPICDQADPDYLLDVFGTGLTSTGGPKCPHLCVWGADAFGSADDKITNNLMGGNKSCHWLSALQAAIMHRALTEKSVKRYLKDCPSCVRCVAFSVSGTSHVSEGPPIQMEYLTISLNESWGWNGNEFVAPVSGVYHFDVSFVKDSYYHGGTQDDVFIYVVRNGDLTTPVATAWSGQGSGGRGTGCVSVNIRLKAGDLISTFANCDWDPKRHIAQYNFSGHLICSCH